MKKLKLSVKTGQVQFLQDWISKHENQRSKAA